MSINQLSGDIITVRDLKVQYGDRVILENVNFDIKRGEIFVIVGGSGCGKSTLLRQLIGLENPTEGQIIIDGEELTQADEKETVSIMRKNGVLFQFNGLFASMTLEENIALILERYTGLSPRQIKEVVDLKLSLVGLSGFQNYKPAEISGGMKKRAALARAMALDPNILFFDEPSSGLDPLTSASLDQLITELNSALQTTMVVVSHDLSSILSISHRIIMLDSEVRGILAAGTPEELSTYKDNENVYRFFNRQLE
ncbi:MAG: ATP-binding cassette domain-containing protein [Ignavibacteria bacterium]|jgi:phospholipid/cholesterol/gamma-HCH transport system ATP-binding protein|nr:ATP-binding cassette domain-containing protein [Ignavibacteria bacterium]